MPLSREQRQIVEAAIPAGIKVPDDFWTDLEAAIEVFQGQQESRKRRPPWRQRKRWQRIDKHIAAATEELREIRKTALGSEFDHAWFARTLRALGSIRQHAESTLIAYDTLGAGYGGSRKPHVELFHRAICDLWTIHLGQPLRTSRSWSGPSGPLIKFFRACADEDIPAETIRSIVDRIRR